MGAGRLHGLWFQRQFDFQNLRCCILLYLVNLASLGLPLVPVDAAWMGRRAFPKPGSGMCFSEGASVTGPNLPHHQSPTALFLRSRGEFYQQRLRGFLNQASCLGWFSLVGSIWSCYTSASPRGKRELSTPRESASTDSLLLAGVLNNPLCWWWCPAHLNLSELPSIWGGMSCFCC